MTFRLILEECRERFGAAPRNLSATDLAEFKLAIPFAQSLSFWFGHPLASLPKELTSIAEQGSVAWAYVVAAQEKLASSANRNSQLALVLYGLSDDLDDKPDLLERIGERLAAEHAKSSFSDLARIWPELGKTLTPDRTEGTALKLQLTFITPAAIPLGRLERKLLPAVVARQKGMHVLPLPKRWWSEALIAYWTERPEPGSS